jgi:predicted lysophospholipase L1 biosynthesis ABC-type transport system permease subunit
MVRGRLVQVNDRAGDARKLHRRPRAASGRSRIQPLVVGAPSGGQYRQRRALARRTTKAPSFRWSRAWPKPLNLKLGDRLTYEIAGKRVEATITSLRKLDWDSMRVNFFVMSPPAVLEDYPASYITSFHLPADKAGVIPELVRRFPNITVIDVAALVRQLHATIDQVARAVQLVFGFAVLAGLAVLYAALQASSDERRHELAVLRALGARSRQLSRRAAGRVRRAGRAGRPARRHRRQPDRLGPGALCLPPRLPAAGWNCGWSVRAWLAWCWCLSPAGWAASAPCCASRQMPPPARGLQPSAQQRPG